MYDVGGHAADPAIKHEPRNGSSLYGAACGVLFVAEWFTGSRREAVAARLAGGA